MSSASTCCGNDPGEDIEQPGEGRPCCYNDDELLHEEHVGAILCHDGELYNCEGDATDHSGLAQNMPGYSYVEDVSDAWCTPNGSWCDWGLMDCSGDSTCETELDNNPTCTSAVEDLGSWCSEITGGGGAHCIPLSCKHKAQSPGIGERWFRFTAQQCGACIPFSVGVKVELFVPPFVDYDLYLRENGCDGDIVAESTSGGLGGYELLTFTNMHTTTFIIEVRYVEGHTCEFWQMHVHGHNCG
jgi:hypothetical protein